MVRYSEEFQRATSPASLPENLLPREPTRLTAYSADGFGARRFRRLLLSCPEVTLRPGNRIASPAVFSISLARGELALFLCPKHRPGRTGKTAQTPWGGRTPSSLAALRADFGREVIEISLFRSNEPVFTYIKPFRRIA